MQNCEGSSGQSGESIKHISLLHDGGFEFGTPAPAFSTYELAEDFRINNDKHNFYHVIGMDVKND